MYQQEEAHHEEERGREVSVQPGVAACERQQQHNAMTRSYSTVGSNSSIRKEYSKDCTGNLSTIRACGKSKMSFPHWPLTSLDEEFRCCLYKHNTHRKYLTECW
jgi:hypothetical protein